MWPRLFVYRNGRFRASIHSLGETGLFRQHNGSLPGQKSPVSGKPLRFFSLLLILAGVIAACQSNRPGFDPIGTLVAPQPTPDSAATAWAAATLAAQPPPMPVYVLGESRSNPLPAGALISLDNWDVQVLDIKRGEAAWQILQAANRLNEPPATGREYLLIQFWIKNKGEDTGSLWLEVTGNHNQLYKYYQADVVRPTPQLDTRLEADEESLGWLAYTIATGENNLLLRVQDGSNFRAAAVYAALEEGASLHRPPALDAIAPTDWGQSAADPLILGQIATTNSWQIQVKEVILGEAAYEKALAHNRFNDPPQPGMQYGLVYVWLRYVGQGESPVSVSIYSTLKAVDAAGNTYARPSLVVPAPQLGGELYAGGETEGWLAIQVPETENAPLLRLELIRGEVRYLSLAATGR
jgi:hypothetical protein